jgi:hypothetical protein
LCLLEKGADYGGRKKIDGFREEPSNAPLTLSDIGIDKKPQCVLSAKKYSPKYNDRMCRNRAVVALPKF